jgi:hypothetical protein
MGGLFSSAKEEEVIVNEETPLTTNQTNLNTTKKREIQFASFEVVRNPSPRFYEIEHRLAEISRIATPDDEFHIWPNSSVLVGYTPDGVLQAFVCLIDTDSYKNLGREWIYDEKWLALDFEARGGLLDEGKKGGFVTSLSGNTKDYYGMGNALLAELYRMCAGLDYLFLHVSESNPMKDKLIRLYERNGFEMLEFPYSEEDGERFVVMRKMLNE